MENLLIIEDDENLGISLKKFFVGEGYQATLCENLSKAREKIKGHESYQAIVLDWMLPDGQGIDLLREIRSQNNQIPIIMLTARTDLIDKVVGLETGANDYLTKPFEPRELLARVRVQLRQQNYAQKVDSDEVRVGDIRIVIHQREIYYKDQKLDLTKMEFDLLKLLVENPNRVFSREEILNKVWGYENYPTTRTVDTHILQLRQKTTDELIETIRGIGYRMKLLTKN